MSRLMLLAILISGAHAAENLTVIDGYAFVQVSVNGQVFRTTVDAEDTSHNVPIGTHPHIQRITTANGRKWTTAR